LEGGNVGELYAGAIAVMGPGQFAAYKAGKEVEVVVKTKQKVEPGGHLTWESAGVDGVADIVKSGEHANQLQQATIRRPRES